MQPVRIQTPNIEAEEAEWRLLGTLLHRNEWIGEIDRLTAAHFCNPWRGDLFAAISERIRAGMAATPATLETWAGIGFDTLLDLYETRQPVARAHVASLERAIMDAHQRRSLVDLAAKLVEAAGHGLTADEIVADTETALRLIAQAGDNADSWESLGDIAARAVEDAQRGVGAGISTGIPKLDECTGGLRPGTFWVVGGASSMGKSVVGQNLAVNVGAQGFGVGYVHLEMSDLDIGLRAAASRAWDMHSTRNPHYLSALRQNLSDVQWSQMRAGARALAGLPIQVDKRAGQTMRQIEVCAKRLVRSFTRAGIKPGAIVVDHQGLIVPEGRGNKVEQAGERATRLQSLAKELDVCLIALAQLNRAGSQKDGEESLPTMNDLEWSADLERCADVVMLVHRPSYYIERKPDRLRTPEERETLAAGSRMATFVVDKSRHGRREHVPVLIDIRSAAMAPDLGGDRA